MGAKSGGQISHKKPVGIPKETEEGCTDTEGRDSGQYFQVLVKCGSLLPSGASALGAKVEVPLR